MHSLHSCMFAQEWLQLATVWLWVEEAAVALLCNVNPF